MNKAKINEAMTRDAITKTNGREKLLADLLIELNRLKREFETTAKDLVSEHDFDNEGSVKTEAFDLIQETGRAIVGCFGTVNAHMQRTEHKAQPKKTISRRMFQIHSTSV
jgi:hypothetical protein